MSAPDTVTVTRSYEQSNVDRYAVGARDMNPIHRETPEAYAGPFGRPVAHGMLVLSLVSEAMSTAFGDAWERGGTLKVRWRQPAFVPIKITVLASLKSEVDGLATYEVVCASAAGETLLTGTATVRPLGAA
ncbi:MAG: MaoC/PaaZ C-terminal domain-containing protein [Dehalococcoidia bacterium]